MLELWQLVLIQAGWMTFQCVGYLMTQRNPRAIYDMERSFDKRIPLVTQSVYIYVLWFPLIAVYPVGLYYFSAGSYIVYMAAVALNVVTSFVIYRVYPTTFVRPELECRNLSSKILSILYITNYKGLNCMPSMHCSISFIIIFSVLTCTEVTDWIQAAVCLLSLGIAVSTVLTKQHVIVDVFSALGLAAVSFAFVNLLV